MTGNIAAIKNSSTAIEVGTRLTLPDTVQAYQPDGSLLSSHFPVKWDVPDTNAFNEEGIVVINCTANVWGEILPVTASVRVAKKTITIDANVALAVVRLSQDIPKELQTDTLDAIIDENISPESNADGGVNPTIWSNYTSAQEGHQTATVRFSYDTAQNLAEVVAYYHQDSWSFRLPKSVQFSWSATEDGKLETIEATEVARKDMFGVTQITYRLAHPVPSVVFTMTVENADEDLGNRKASVGLVELELKTALENFDFHNDARITEIRMGKKKLRNPRIPTELSLPDLGSFTASNPTSNVGLQSFLKRIMSLKSLRSQRIRHKQRSIRFTSFQNLLRQKIGNIFREKK